MNLDTWRNVPEIINSIYTGEEHTAYWHYSSLNGVLGMFKKHIERNDDVIDTCDMWASNIRFMNDTQEYSNGLATYKKHLQSTGRDVPEKLVSDNIYLISFCKEGDLLSQWKWYGKNSGIAIRFEMENIAFSTYKKSSISSKKSGDSAKSNSDTDVLLDTQTKPLSVKYTEEQKNKYIQKIEETNILGEKSSELKGSVFIPFCKDDGFIEEQEYRLVFYVCDDMPKLSDSEKFVFDYVYNTNEEGRTKPALNVHMQSYSLATPYEDNIEDKKNIVSEMIVGPGNNQELVFNCLIHAFDRDNYSFQDLKNVPKPEEALDWAKFIEQPADQKVHWVKRNDSPILYDKDKTVAGELLKESKESNTSETLCYKCRSGLILSVSRIPFRG